MVLRRQDFSAGLKLEQVKHLVDKARQDVADMSLVVHDPYRKERLVKGHTGLLVYRISQPN